MVAPVPSLLIRQLVHYPAIVLSSEPTFRRARGYAFEDYAHDLACRIATGDRRKWDPSKNRNVGSGEIDTLLWASGTAVLMEHKAGHLALTLGSLSAAMGALGPHDDALPALNESKRPKDGGAVTEAIWQFSGSGAATEAYLEKRYKRVPISVRPLVVTLEPFRIEEWLRRGYLDPLAHARPRRDATRARWTPPEWLHIGELEALAQLADEGALDLEELLSRKSNVSFERMDVFLSNQQTGHKGLPIDRELLGRAESLLKQAHLRYFGSTEGADDS